MKNYIYLALIGLIPFAVKGQSNDSTASLGFALNSSVNGELYPIRIVPSVTYKKGKSQLEVGVGFNISDRKFQKIVSSELNYKYFPNGTENKFNLYLITRFAHVHSARDTYYPTQYNYLFLNGGYGFEINAFKGVYLGTNISTGVFTSSKSSEIPYESFASQKLFEDFGYNVAFQFNAGYRF